MKINSKIIMIEGLPGSGKSTIAQFIAHQLKKNNISAEWYYGMGLEHPLDFSFEACLNEVENDKLLDKYSDYKSILESENYMRYDKYLYKYIEIQRKYKNQLPNELIEDLENFDLENDKSNFYFDVKLEKWEQFIKSADSADRITIIESSFLQGPIVDLLLKDEKKEDIKTYIHKLLCTINEVNPVLFYLYQEDIDTSIRKMFNFRGNAFTEYIVNMINESQYGQNHNLNGVDGAIDFFKEYRNLTDELYSDFKICKLAIENSEGKWILYKKKILEFLGIEYKKDKSVLLETLEKYSGNYVNNELEKEMLLLMVR